jgi:magnesium-transporting ATPase (P-type)
MRAASASDAVQLAGLTSTEASRRLAEVGPNALPEGSRPRPWLLLARQMTHFFAVMLWVAAALAVFAGMPQLAVAIVVVILVNGGFAFVQEYRADQAADRLRELIPAAVTVRRDGQRQLIPARDLVPGDLVVLEAGDRICGDLRIVAGAGIAVDESMLTGESVPRRISPPGQAYAGTFVVEGAVEAVVTGTGSGTRLAGIAALTRRTHRPPSPLAVRLNRVVRVVAVAAVGVGTVFFALSLLLGASPAKGFLFALGVTVALVPEGLLPTVTLALAWGARKMAARNALVKRLESVEALGSVTFICTDKTGTLTRNEMTVVEVWTPAGTAHVAGVGYQPTGTIDGPLDAVRELAYSAVRASAGRLVNTAGRWRPTGDPMEVALHVLAMRAGLDIAAAERAEPRLARYPFDSRRLCASTLAAGTLHVKGAPEAVLARCVRPDGAAAVA